MPLNNHRPGRQFVRLVMRLATRTTRRFTHRAAPPHAVEYLLRQPIDTVLANDNESLACAHRIPTVRAAQKMLRRRSCTAVELRVHPHPRQPYSLHGEHDE